MRIFLLEIIIADTVQDKDRHADHKKNQEYNTGEIFRKRFSLKEIIQAINQHRSGKAGGMPSIVVFAIGGIGCAIASIIINSKKSQ